MTAELVAEAQYELQHLIATTLTRRIREEPDPNRQLEIIALAIRSRPAAHHGIPHPPHPPRTRTNTPALHPAKPPSEREEDDSTDEVSSKSTPPQPIGITNTGSSFFPPARTPEFYLPPRPPPTLMTEQEFQALSDQIGPTEATRRRLIRAHLVSIQDRKASDSS